jgi:hypothetical protein
MVWLATPFGRKPTVTLEFLVARSKELQRDIETTEAYAERLRQQRAALEASAAAAGLATHLAAALEPKKPPEQIPHVRIRAIRPYRVVFAGRYGPEEHSGNRGQVIDIPSVLLSELQGEVEVVAANTELRGVPLPPGILVDDD